MNNSTLKVELINFFLPKENIYSIITFWRKTEFQLMFFALHPFFCADSIVRIINCEWETPGSLKWHEITALKL